MDVIELEGEEAAAAERMIDIAARNAAAFMRSMGVKSGEALVMTDPPVSDVDAD